MMLQLPDLSQADGPLEFLIGIIANQAIRAEAAWRVAAGLRERLGHLDAHRFAAMHEAELAGVLGQRTALHPFARSMARYLTGACRLVCDDYHGSASALWDDTPTAAALIGRLTALPGIGKHKAEVALFLLVREYGVPVIEDRPADAALSHCARLRDFFGPLAPADHDSEDPLCSFPSSPSMTSSSASPPAAPRPPMTSWPG